MMPESELVPEPELEPESELEQKGKQGEYVTGSPPQVTVTTLPEVDTWLPSLPQSCWYRVLSEQMISQDDPAHLELTIPPSQV